MPTLRKLLALVLAAAPLAASNVWAFGTTQRVEVPIRQLTLPDGMIRYSVPVSVGGNPPIDAMLDTGSLRTGTRGFAQPIYAHGDLKKLSLRERRSAPRDDSDSRCERRRRNDGHSNSDPNHSISRLRGVEAKLPGIQTASRGLRHRGRWLPQEGFPSHPWIIDAHPSSRDGCAQPTECLRQPQLDSNPATT